MRAKDKADIAGIIAGQHRSAKAKASSYLCCLCTDKIQASKSDRHTVGVPRPPPKDWAYLNPDKLVLQIKRTSPAVMLRRCKGSTIVHLFTPRLFHCFGRSNSFTRACDFRDHKHTINPETTDLNVIQSKVPPGSCF